MFIKPQTIKAQGITVEVQKGVLLISDSGGVQYSIRVGAGGDVLRIVRLAPAPVPVEELRIVLTPAKEAVKG
jgi:hypothetical protein